jgi:hypothetical protein
VCDFAHLMRARALCAQRAEPPGQPCAHRAEALAERAHAFNLPRRPSASASPKIVNFWVKRAGSWDRMRERWGWQTN